MTSLASRVGAVWVGLLVGFQGFRVDFHGASPVLTNGLADLPAGTAGVAVVSH